MRVIAMVALSTFVWGCAGRLGIEKPSDTTTQVKEHVYQFVLINPQTGKPWARRPYALSIDGFPLPSARVTNGVEYGVSDAAGRTAPVRLDRVVPNDKWLVVERIGDGAYGQRFQLVSASGRLMAKQAYQMVICSQPILTYNGYTDSRGYVAYAASKDKAQLRVMVGSTYTNDEMQAMCADMVSEEGLTG